MSCWPWEGKTKNGYGVTYRNQKPIYAHRVAFMMEHGVILDEYDKVYHSCGNKLCCNPAHLEWR